MGVGFYEHSVEVRFNEQLLNSTNDWRWFIECTENDFEPPEEIESINDFFRSFSSVRSVYFHLAKIVDYFGEIEPSFSTVWLQELYESALVRSGFRKPDDFSFSEGFFTVLSLASYGTYLLNCLSDTTYLFNPQLLFNTNLHQLYEFDSLGDEKSRFICLAKTVSVSGFEDVVRTLEANFGGETNQVDEENVKAIMDACFDEDFLSFKIAEGKMFQTWQESLLCDALKTTVRDESIEPMIRFRNGSGSPDYSQWAEGVLALAIDAFNDERAICVLESIRYYLFGMTPSLASQNLFVMLFVEHVEHCIEIDDSLRMIACTALTVIQSLLKSKQLDEEPRKRFFKDVLNLTSKRMDYSDICYLKDHSLQCTKQQDEAYVIKSKNIMKDSLDVVAGAYDLIKVFNNPLCAKYCDDIDAKRSFDFFNQFVQGGGLETAELFYWAMMFYIDLLSNSKVDNRWVKSVLISLRHLWQDRYYASTIANMQLFSSKGSITKDEVDELNIAFFENPHSFARSVFLQSDNEIAKELATMSEHAIVYLFNKTTISEYYPEHVHVILDRKDSPIDEMIAQEVRRVYDENSFRFLNALSDQEMLDGFFENLTRRTLACSQLIDIEPAYGWIADNVSRQYELLPFPGNHPMLGHLTQLFPVLESTIRNIGELFAIVPFKRTKDSFSCLKGVSSVLSDLIKEVCEITGTIQGCNEFLFVYNVMYSINGLNIRNDCVHGRRYQGPADVATAFRMTVICTYMMLKRLRDLEAFASNNAENN